MARPKNPARGPGSTRPTKMTPGVVAEIANAISHGLTDQEAADLVGIDDLTLTRWHKKPEFRKAIKQAVARRKLLRLQKIDAGDPGWQGAAWHAERTDPSRFARPEIQVQIAQITANGDKAAHNAIWFQPPAQVAGQPALPDIEFDDFPDEPHQQPVAEPQYQPTSPKLREHEARKADAAGGAARPIEVEIMEPGMADYQRSLNAHSADVGSVGQQVREMSGSKTRIIGQAARPNPLPRPGYDSNGGVSMIDWKD